MTTFLTYLAKYWREALIAGLLAVVVGMYATLGNRNDTIKALDITIAENAAVEQNNNAWTTATTNILTNVIDTQNQGIDRVLGAMSVTSADIAAQMTLTRTQTAEKVKSLQTTVQSLPTATNCEILMNNLIQTGGAVKW